MEAERFANLLSDGKTGFRLVIGSWKIIEMSLPRMLRISRSDFFTKS